VKIFSFMEYIESSGCEWSYEKLEEFDEPCFKTRLRMMTEKKICSISNNSHIITIL
jgi:hypothetical protein